MSCRIVRPRVDLPQPDSPTRPSASPWVSVKLTPSTALTVPDLAAEEDALLYREMRPQIADFQERFGHGWI
jgi:hypothetical protein